MTSPAVLYAALWALLDPLTDVKAYEAEVPANLPAEQTTGRVLPYAVLWPTAGGRPFDVALVDDGSGLDWGAQITVAAGDVTWALGAVDVVRSTVVGHVLVPGASPIVDETPATLPLTKDPAPGPPRWYVPLQLRCAAP